ncbi:hypothetical protein P5F14_15290 [Clostridium perfringens]|nr:hypothetical protein [Clostridium perfringens]
MYKCETCKYNNNGWCNIKKFNGLKKKNIQECEKYKTNATELIMYKGIDGLGQDDITIKINNEEVYIPLKVIKDFISNDKVYRIKVDIPE